ncbi:MAG: foldase [Gammaproteobacteria bacterium]|nr:MAG: foldase [Gammaproteobacteria bacterium]
MLQEAESLKLDQTPSFQKELDSYRKGLLYRLYMRQLRNSVAMPAEVKAAIAKDLRGEADAQAAARSANIATLYKQAARDRLTELRQKYHVRTWDERIREGITADTVLLEGDGGLSIRYGDIVDPDRYSSLPDRQAIESELYKRAELEVIAKAAVDAGLDVTREVESYRTQRLPALLMEKKTAEWSPDEAGLQSYYDEHPEISKVPDQWLVGQIVLADRKQAEAVKQRIDNGESLFKLAGELSIDPWGKARNGDMGWMIQGKGIPEIEAALGKLDNGEVSDVIQTPLGFHVVTVLDRKPGQTLSLTTLKNRIIQNIVSQKRADYLQTLQKKHKVVWKVLDQQKQVKPAPMTAKDS